MSGVSRVKCVRAYTQTSAAKGDQGGDCHDVADNHWIDGGMSPIACPMAVTMTSNFLCILLKIRVPGEIKRSRDLRGGRWSWTLTFAQKRS